MMAPWCLQAMLMLASLNWACSGASDLLMESAFAVQCVCLADGVHVRDRWGACV